MVMAQATKMGMLFVRCRGGVSHSPLEHTDESDVAAGVAALYKFLQRQVAASQPAAQTERTNAAEL